MAEIGYDWDEPAQAVIVKRNNDLVTIYTHIRNKYQAEIDNAFDRVSRQIGFVVTTIVPMVLEVGEKSVAKSIIIGAEHLRGTIFEKELSAALGSLKGNPIGTLDPDGDPAIRTHITAGVYKLDIFWFEAIKLKLKTDWLEPPHFRVDLADRAKSVIERLNILQELVTKKVPPKPKPGDPPQWFVPGTLMDVEERVLISAIDEVYPELRLVDRITSIRQAELEVGALETGRSRQANTQEVQQVLSEISSTLRRYGY